MKGHLKMMQLWTELRARLASERGATMVEYGIVVSLIAIVSILVVGALGVDVFGSFDQGQASFASTTGPTQPTP
jgi:pilus assembly protein Flp/PilA